MRVHIDGLLPLIKTSVVEFPSGDEVTTTLVYERLDKHCTKCLKLNHEIKECLVARAEDRAAKAKLEETAERAESIGHRDEENRSKHAYSEAEQNQGAFRFSASNREETQSKVSA